MKKLILIFTVFLPLFSACTEQVPEHSGLISETSFLECSTDENSTTVSYDSSADITTEARVNMKAVWITQFDMLSIVKDNGIQRDRASFTALFEQLLDNINNDGYNTAIVQVRPYADSYYPSEYFPVSNYVSGKFGNENIYDPFEIIVDLAKERGISVHAWINPMRGMKTNEIINVPDKYPIKQWYLDEYKKGKYLVELDGRVYLNPAYEEVRQLIADGTKEVAEKYDIDGVHMDDYFYPTKDSSFDHAAYAEFTDAGGKKSLSEFRYEMIDLMVSGIYSSVKMVDEQLLFGISPMGNIDLTYTDYYTDVYKWCSEDGYIDYICPQIYFGLEHQTHDFIKVYNIWQSIIKNDRVKMCAGITLGKAKSGVDNYAGTGKHEWAENKDVIKRCIEYISGREECEGIVVFCYQHMYDPLTGESVEETKNERDNMKSVLKKLWEN